MQLEEIKLEREPLKAKPPSETNKMKRYDSSEDNQTTMSNKERFFLFSILVFGIAIFVSSFTLYFYQFLNYLLKSIDYVY